MSTPHHPKHMVRTHTPLMSERKKSLFKSRDCLTSPFSLPAVHSESESDSDGRSLGVAVLDSSSSCDEHEPCAPTHAWRETRSSTRRLLKENQDMFIKSPYTLRNFQNRIQNGVRPVSVSTPATPHIQHNPTTPSSSHSTASACTTSSGHGRARRSLAELIADTESCSSSLKDLNFDSDSEMDSKENTPTKSTRKSSRLKTMTPKFASFKGILSEQKKKNSSTNWVKSIEMISPTQMMKTPHSMTQVESPPKFSHNRRTAVEVEESPEDIHNPNKRVWNDSIASETGPKAKIPKLNTPAPKARLSLFNSEKLKEMLSTKSFYGRSTGTPQPVVAKIAKVISNTEESHKRTHAHKKKQRLPGQINMGVRHRIRRPKLPRYGHIIKMNMQRPESWKAITKNNDTTASATNSQVNPSTAEHGSNVDMVMYDIDKGDRFDREHETIDALLNQWTEEEVPSTEPQLVQSLEESHAKIRSAESLLCFNKAVIEENNVLINPNSAVSVSCIDIPQDVLGLTDLDAMERELAILDDQLEFYKTQQDSEHMQFVATDAEPPRMFPIFDKTPATVPSTSSPSTPKGGLDKKKMILKSGQDQYIIDAGQKKFGATQCKECGVIYQIGDPQDEHDHLVHHNAEDVLRFNGWREENVAGVWEESRCVCLRGSDARWRRVTALLERVVHPQLGYAGALPHADKLYAYTAYLFINKKQIVGCLIAEPKEKACRLIQDGGVDCCSEEEYPVKCGISRVWTHVSHRRHGVATRMLNCARKTFLFGHILDVEDIAFSAPTPAGIEFARRYTKRNDFLIYLD